MIEVRGLTKRYGDKLAVDGLTFTVRPGIVTGFLGPNGAGKSTTLRMILGLDAPTSGTATVNGRPYRDYADPLHEAGALLEAKPAHPGRSAYHHLLAIAQTSGIPSGTLIDDCSSAARNPGSSAAAITACTFETQMKPRSRAAIMSSIQASACS